jgi:acyl-CoA thioesterase
LAAAFEQVIDGVSVNTTGLPPGSVTTAYAAGLTATGGYARYKWSVVGGSLPAGLHLRAATGQIVGKPKTPGISTFTVQAVDTRGRVRPTTQNSGTATLSLQVLAAPEGMPSSGPYATPQYTGSQITEYTVQYSSAHFSQQGFIQFLAFDPVNAGGGTATMRLTPKSEHLNHNGTINAAVLYGLAEVAGAGAVVADMLELAAENYTVVKRATIEYLAPARGIVEATGHVDGAEIEYAKAQLGAGAAVEVDVPVSVKDKGGTEVVTLDSRSRSGRSVRRSSPPSVGSLRHSGLRGPSRARRAHTRGYSARCVSIWPGRYVPISSGSRTVLI